MSETPSKQSIEALLAQSPTASSNRPQLEAYVDGEARGTVPYYMDANRKLLKLYQLFPQSANESKTAVILLLSLLQFPSTDLLAMSYMIPEKIAKMEPTASILHCADLLDACKFGEFWQVYGSILDSDETLNSLLAANGGTERLQRSILDVLACSYRTASLSTVLVALNITNGDDIAKMNHPSVESVTADKVAFAPTADNTKRNRVFQEGVNFAAISSMMARVSTE